MSRPVVHYRGSFAELFGSPLRSDPFGPVVAAVVAERAPAPAPASARRDAPSHIAFVDHCIDTDNGDLVSGGCCRYCGRLLPARRKGARRVLCGRSLCKRRYRNAAVRRSRGGARDP